MITSDELKVIAELAKLSVDENTLDEINAIASYAGIIKNADLTGADLTEHEIRTALREDIVLPSTPQSVVLGSAEDSVGGYFIARGM